jgi:Putative adhesin
MRRLSISLLAVPVLAALFLAPPTASAAEQCQYQAPRKLHLDLAGVRQLQVQVNSHDLHVAGNPGATALDLNGRACASDASLLDGLQVKQHREGDQLIIELVDDNHRMHMFGYSYSGLNVTIQLPASLPVLVDVGSGDADASGLRQLASQVGSGDLHASHIADVFSTGVGSGDVVASDVGRLDASAIGSGDLKATDIRGDAKIGSIGSGDVVLAGVGGSVHAQTLGSGDLSVKDVRGDFSLGAKGSGDVRHAGVGGKISVPHGDDD